MNKPPKLNRLIVVSTTTILISYLLYHNYNHNLYYSITRNISRTTGHLANYKIPLSMRELIFNWYINIYNVNRQEIKKDLI